MPRSTTVLLAVLAVGAAIGAVFLAAGSPPGTTGPPGAEPAGLETFDSAAAFEAYVARADRTFGSTGRFQLGFDGAFVTADSSVTMESTAATGQSAPPDRYSSTNVQEVGIDEPDLVKTDGSTAYYSPGRQFGFARKGPSRDVHLLGLTPPGSVEALGSINDSGRLLLAEETLVVLGADAVVGYDVAAPGEPEQVWERTLDGHVVDARMMDGQIFLVAASGVDDRLCPVEPLDGVSTPCSEVYHTTPVAPAEATYTVTRLDVATGDPAGATSFVGSRDSVIYMSEESLYVTSTRPTPRGELLTQFLLEEVRADLPTDAVDRLERVQGYNLTDRAQYYEARHVLDSWLGSLDEDERERANERLAERYRSYTRENLRELTTTRIIEVDAATLQVAETGTVPGEPLNQWALDEHEGTLRIATTVHAPRLGWEGANSTNDVYTLSPSLDVTGSVTDMSEGQEVFGVRFEGDTGYVITFRRVDPLHVLDLSEPTAPEELGELELPGFSRYLHPLSEDRLLGIGEEDGRVKTVVFDVSTPTDPTVEESRVLRARWSEAVNDHHAFLEDPRHDVFYIPTEFGGQVLSTEDLSTRHEVDLAEPRRAIYVDDYLYVFGTSEVAVIDERSWERAETLPLE